MRRAAGGGLALLCALAASPASPAGADGPPSPRALYDAAFDHWRELTVPPFSTYDGKLTIVRDGKSQLRLYTVAYRAADRRCRVTGVAIDARDRPDPTYVTQRCVRPDLSFTFVPQKSDAGDATGLNLNIPTPEPSEAADIKTITSVRARSRPYDVTFAGNETIDGKETTHLALRPYRDPAKHILRDVWIDPATNGVVRLRGEATSGPNLIHVDFTATYAEDANAQTLARVDAFAKAQLLLFHESGNISFDLTNVAHPAALPDATFVDRKR